MIQFRPLDGSFLEASPDHALRAVGLASEAPSLPPTLFTLHSHPEDPNLIQLQVPPQPPRHPSLSSISAISAISAST